MAKELERAGLPTAHVCSIVPISRTVGANRIVPSVAIPHPLGDPDLLLEARIALRDRIVQFERLLRLVVERQDDGGAVLEGGIAIGGEGGQAGLEILQLDPGRLEQRQPQADALGKLFVGVGLQRLECREELLGGVVGLADFAPQRTDEVDVGVLVDLVQQP